MGRLLPFLIVANVVLTAAALISCLSTEDGQVKGLPRIGWVIVILLFPPIGAIAWFFAGRERTPKASGGWRMGGGFPQDDRPRRTTAPDDDPDFLRKLDRSRLEREAAEQIEAERDMLRQWEDDLRKREDDIQKKDKPEEA